VAAATSVTYAQGEGSKVPKFHSSRVLDVPLTAGSRIGSFEVLGPLGAGGMGEVYRARDIKLGREVAIKVLPDAVAADAERIARFEREAKALAALNHPHIATLFGMEHAEGRHLLVMELVEGPTLAEKIGAGGVAGAPGARDLDETLAMAIQIAEALEAAHERGIVHRDLKPANIKVTGEPLSVKVLDFGLAKALDTADGKRQTADGAGFTNSPTLSIMATGAGMILGTAAYMSPEQAKGQPTDHRSDIFSFGCVLFEMITGRAAFDGENPSEILASVIKSEPDWSRLSSDLHPRLLQLLKRCLEKTRRQRWQAIGDVRLELEHIRTNPRTSPITRDMAAASRATPMWRRVAVAATLVLVGAAATAAVLVNRGRGPAPQPIRFTVPLREGEVISGANRRQVALSPDGLQLAYVASQRLYVRRVDELESRPLTDTIPGLTSPVYSPDGNWIGFHDSVAQELKRVESSGGVPTRVARLQGSPADLDWSPHGFFYTSDQGVMRLDEQSGSQTVVVKAETGETFGSFSTTPDGAFLVSSARGLAERASPAAVAFDRAQILAVKPDGQRRVILEEGTGARYLSSGHIVFIRQGIIFAVPFDARRLNVTGTPVPVIDGVARAQSLGQFSVSAAGALVFVPGSATGSAGPWQPGIFTRNLDEPFRIPPGPYTQAMVSPDGKTVALSRDDDKESAIWLYDLTGTSALRRLTLGAPARFPVWTPDGKRVIYQREAENGSGIVSQRADGTDTPEQLTASAPGVTHIPYAWLPDGEHLLFDEIKDQQVTLSIYSFRDRKATAIPDAGSNVPTGATLSPNGRWIAFTRRRTGNRSAVFVQPYPPTGALYQISETATEDGHHPAWSRDGRSLAYNAGPGRPLKVVQIKTEPSFSLGAVREQPVSFLHLPPNAPRPFDLLPDGRFVGFQGPGGANSAASHMVVVLNWIEELKQRVPVAR
jgi:serine/threonine-protein kinase